MELYTDELASEAVSQQEAERRASLISGALCTQSRRHNAVYWDAMFKFGGGPDQPLKALAETAGAMPTGATRDGWPANDLKGRVIRAVMRKLP